MKTDKPRFDIQNREDWQLRAVKLQLLHPEMFAQVAACLVAQAPQRQHTNQVFNLLESFGVLDQIDFGTITSYRMGLFIRACRSHMRRCARGAIHGRQLETQSP